MLRHARILAVLFPLALLAQTATTAPVNIDLGILYQILPVMITLLVIMLIFGLFANLFKSFGRFASEFQQR